MIDRLLNSERAKVLTVVLIVALATALTGKNVISYPKECMIEEMANLYEPAVKRA